MTSISSTSLCYKKRKSAQTRSSGKVVFWSTERNPMWLHFRRDSPATLELGYQASALFSSPHLSSGVFYFSFSHLTSASFQEVLPSWVVWPGNYRRWEKCNLDNSAAGRCECDALGKHLSCAVLACNNYIWKRPSGQLLASCTGSLWF